MNNRGFTLIEISVVVALIGLMLSITVPTVRDALLTDGLKKTANYLINSAGELRNNALREQVNYILHIDIDRGCFWTSSADMTPEARAESKDASYCAPPGVRIADFYRFGQEKVFEGEVTIGFFKGGYLEPAVLHLSEGNRAFTVVFEPFLHKVTLYDSYRDIEAKN